VAIVDQHLAGELARLQADRAHEPADHSGRCHRQTTPGQHPPSAPPRRRPTQPATTLGMTAASAVAETTFCSTFILERGCSEQMPL
jgi:hypothetical protein